MPPTKPPSKYISAVGSLPKTWPMPSTNLVPSALCDPPGTYLSVLVILVIICAAFTTVGSVKGSLPNWKRSLYLSGPAVRRYIISNQSVSVQESPAPTAQGVLPAATIASVTLSMSSQVFGTCQLPAVKWSG